MVNQYFPLKDRYCSQCASETQHRKTTPAPNSIEAYACIICGNPGLEFKKQVQNKDITEKLK